MFALPVLETLPFCDVGTLVRHFTTRKLPFCYSGSHAFSLEKLVEFSRYAHLFRELGTATHDGG